MAKKKNKDKNDVVDELELLSLPDGEEQEEPKTDNDVPVLETPVVPEPAPVRIWSASVNERLISFDEYFFLKKRPSNHFTGMSRFTNVKIKRTFADWEIVFSKY